MQTKLYFRTSINDHSFIEQDDSLNTFFGMVIVDLVDKYFSFALYEVVLLNEIVIIDLVSYQNCTIVDVYFMSILRMLDVNKGIVGWG